MSVVTINDEHLKNIANAIRQKSGETDKYKPSEMANAIKDIPVGGSEPILQNITIKPSIIDQSFVADAGYDAIGVVNVSKVTSDIDSDIKASNIKKGVNILGVDGTLEEGIIPSGTMSIIENGSYDITNFASVNVNVEKSSANEKYAPRYIRFTGYTGAELDYELENIDLINLTTMYNMFSSCKKLVSVDLSKTTYNNTTTMESCFSSCSSLETINLGASTLPKVTTMKSCFASCAKLETLDAKNFVLSACTHFVSTFNGCSSLKRIDLRNVTGAKASSVEYMFAGCSSLEHIDLRSFSFSNVNYFTGVFNNVPSNCEIIVKDSTAKNNLLSNTSNLTNIKTLAEYQAEGGV